MAGKSTLSWYVWPVSCGISFSNCKTALCTLGNDFSVYITSNHAVSLWWLGLNEGHAGLLNSCIDLCWLSLFWGSWPWHGYSITCWLASIDIACQAQATFNLQLPCIAQHFFAPLNPPRCTPPQYLTKFCVLKTFSKTKVQTSHPPQPVKLARPNKSMSFFCWDFL